MLYINNALCVDVFILLTYKVNQLSFIFSLYYRQGIELTINKFFQVILLTYFVLRMKGVEIICTSVGCG